MTFNRYINGIDNCKPPVCPEDINIDIINIACIEDKTITVEWTVSDLYNRNIDINSNVLYWGCGITNPDDINSYNNSIISSRNTQPYTASFDASSCSELIYLKVKIKIETSSFYSEVKVYDTDLCGGMDNLAVPATWCDDEGVKPEYYLYASLSSVSSLPFTFVYDNECWEIENIDSPISVDNLPEGSILADVSDSFNSCSDCLEQSDCPSEWRELPDGDRIGTYYFEYQTYIIKDRIYIVSNFSEEDYCESIPYSPSVDKILYDTGCVGTDNCDSSGEPDCSGFRVSSPYSDSRFYPNRKTYGFCLDVRESQLPLGIVIDCNCAGSNGTIWKVYSEDPDGNTDFVEGGNECSCDIVSSEWYTSPLWNYGPWSSDAGGGKHDHWMSMEVQSTSPGVVEYWFEGVGNDAESGWHSTNWENEWGWLLEAYQYLILLDPGIGERYYRCKWRNSVTLVESEWSETKLTVPYESIYS